MLQHVLQVANILSKEQSSQSCMLSPYLWRGGKRLLSSLGPWSHIPNGQPYQGETQISERNSNLIENQILSQKSSQVNPACINPIFEGGGKRLFILLLWCDEMLLYACQVCIWLIWYLVLDHCGHWQARLLFFGCVPIDAVRYDTVLRRQIDRLECLDRL